MPETIINNIRGDKLEAKSCAFCGNEQNYKFFGIEAGKRFDGILLRHFGVCEEHLAKLNSLLSGEFDIDKINLEQYRKIHLGKGLRLR